MSSISTTARTSFSLTLIFTCLVAASIAATVTPAYAAKNSIGKATLTEGKCQDVGLSGGTCYRVVITDCPEATGEFAANIKVNPPANSTTSQGTVFFTTGGEGNAFYDYDQDFIGDSRCAGSNCGLMTVQSINAANYRTVQVNFVDPEGLIGEPNGWLTGPAIDGPRSLACRYATLVHAVWTKLLASDTTHAVCATGNSGGGALVAYAITQYEMGNTSGPGPMFTMVETTSAPPYGRIDHGCAGTAAPVFSVNCPAQDRISEDYDIETAQSFVDPAYPTAVCSADINSNGKDVYKYFHHDSVVSDDFSAPSYKTLVRSLFGSDDLSAAVPLGTEWYDAIKSTKAAACIAGAPHNLPQDYNGATTIVNDITNYCKN